MWLFLGIVSFSVFFGYGLWRRLSWAIGWTDDKGIYRTAGGQRYKFTDSTNKNVRKFVIAVPCAPGVSLRIHRESWWDRLAKNIGLSYEFQFNDHEFDNQLYVVSNAPAFQLELAETKALRQVLILLFRDARLIRIECHGQHVLAKFQETIKDGKATTPESAEVQRVVAALYGLAETLEIAKSKTSSIWDVFQLRASLLAVLATSLLLLGSVELFRVYAFERAQIMIDVGDLLTFSTVCAGSVLFVLMAATVVLLRGSSYAHVILAEVLISGGAGLAMGSYVMVRDINISFDQTVQRRVQAEVVDKRTWRGRKSGTHYDLYLKGRDGFQGLPSKLEVSSDVYRQVQAGKPVTLIVRDGALGYRWIEEYNFN